jgi:nitric oxide reductase large subunit
MPEDITVTVSENGVDVIQEEQIESYVGTLTVTVQMNGEEYVQTISLCNENLEEIDQKLDTVVSLMQETVSQNSVEPTLSENDIPENPLVTTKLTEYSLTDSLLLVVILLLLLTNVLQFIFRKGD